MSDTIEITEAIARKVVETVDAGLVHGKGQPIPGQMCVEAAVCFAMGCRTATTHRVSRRYCGDSRSV